MSLKIIHSINNYGRRQEFSLQSFIVGDKGVEIDGCFALVAGG